MWRAPEPLDALVSLGDHLGQGRRGAVGQLHGLAAGPQPSTGFSSGAYAGGARPPVRTAGLPARPASRCCDGRATRPTARLPPPTKEHLVKRA
jgi:hypothetical protein